MPRTVWGVYFSATGTTKKIVTTIANHLAAELECESKMRDFTLPDGRKEVYVFGEEDIVILGTPVYAGRVPNVLLPFLKTICGNGAAALPVVLYGNRNFDDAVAELRDICEGQGFRCVAAGAFVGEHAFSNVLAAGRPDYIDINEAMKFAEKAAERIEKGKMKEHLRVTGNSPSPGYYQPKGPNGQRIDIRKVKPLVNSECDDCKKCVSLCPMGSICVDNVREYQGICIKCGACIKGCHKGARYYDDEGYLYHKKDLEETWKRRAGVVIWF